MSSKIENDAPRAGWRILEWCRAIGGSRAWYYTLDAETAPRARTIGRMHVIIEAPDAWLQRVGRDVKRKTHAEAA